MEMEMGDHDAREQPVDVTADADEVHEVEMEAVEVDDEILRPQACLGRRAALDHLDHLDALGAVELAR